MRAIVMLLLVCLTTSQVKNEVCRLICRNDTYDTGIYLSAQKACLCGVIKQYTELEEKRLNMPTKIKPVEKQYYYNY